MTARYIFVCLCIALTGCQTTGGLPADALFPAVPKELVECAKRKGVIVPERKLAQDEAEKLWRGDRYTIVVLKACFNQLLVRDQKLAKR